MTEAFERKTMEDFSFVICHFPFATELIVQLLTTEDAAINNSACSYKPSTDVSNGK
jgi:hypothetical protein